MEKKQKGLTGKRIIVVALALVLAIAGTFALAGCGAENQESGAAQAADSSAAENENGSAQEGETADTQGDAEENESSNAAEDEGGETADTQGDVEENESSEAAEDECGEAAENESAGAIMPGDPKAPADSVYDVFDGALFIGDSRTEGFKLYSGVTNATFYSGKSMTLKKMNDGEKVNVGGTDRSLQEVLAAGTYTKVFISVGLNELGWNYIEDFEKEYEKLITSIRSAQPSATIYIEDIVPVTEERSAKGDIINNSQIYWYNTHIVEIAERTGCVYLNVDGPLIDHDTGALLPDATTDGVHYKSQYCVKWAQYLAQIIR